MRQKYLSVKQAAVYLTLAPSTIYAYIHYGKIPFAKIGERVVLEQEKLDRWIKSKTTGGRR
jgi:excisionase family DNA binding protein